MGNPLPWSENFAVGHETVDKQHRRLVELINEIDAALEAAKVAARLPHLVKLLRLSAEEHFREEDALLWEIKMGTYGPIEGRSHPSRSAEAMANTAFDEHIAEHAAMLARLDAIVGASPDALSNALKSWFVDHVIKQDSHLKAIFQAM
jgi:hemerythrin